MQWYFTLCQDAMGLYFEFAKVAVHTARKYTKLEPHLLYEGLATDPRLAWFRRNGIIVHCYKSQWEDFVEKTWKHKCMLGTMIKIDIPLFAQEDYVLYADADVMFNGDVSDLALLRPKYIAASTEFKPDDFSYFNAGVMVLNIKNLRQSHDLFSRYIRRNATSEWTIEQTPLNHFYPNDWFDCTYNWKAYWDFNEQAKIIHFHALKPYDLHAWGWGHLRSEGFEKSIDLYHKHEDEIVLPKFEQLYLERNPDVHDAVKAGGLACGYKHYCRFGINESRPFWDFSVP